MSKFFLILSLSFFIIGASDCAGQSKDRFLKLSVEVKPVAAQVVKLPDGRTIDFPYIANALFYYSVMADPHFMIDNPIQSGYPTVGTASLLHEETDDELLSRWGFINSDYKTFGVEMPINPPCIEHAPELKLFANVIAFELVGSGGIHGGYPGVPVGGSLKFDSTQLSVTVQTEDPLKGVPIAIDAGRASESKLSAEIDFMGMAGLDFFLKTSLFNVVTAAFRDSLKNLITAHLQRLNVPSWTQAWQSKVIFDPVISNGDTHLAMRSGWRANVRVGDTFSVYNMHYKWVDDKVCEGQLFYAIPHPAEPIADIRIVEVGQDVSIGLVTRATSVKVDAGAITKIIQLKK